VDSSGEDHVHDTKGGNQTLHTHLFSARDPYSKDSWVDHGRIVNVADQNKFGTVYG